MKLHPDKNNIILDARGAKWFVENLPKEKWNSIDTIILDPPYLDSNNKNDIEQVNKRSKLKSPRISWSGTPIETRLMDPKERKEIIAIIRDNINEKARILHFHSREERLPKIENECCSHVWVKPINIVIAGNCCRNNGEWILIEGPKLKGKIKGQILSRFMTVDPEMKNIKGVQQVIRSCAKPTKLFSELYRHLNSKHILDPFAGYGRSILAALERNVLVDAIDIDKNLELVWKEYQNYKTLEQYF